MAATAIATTAIQPNIFKELSAFVTTFIAEKDAVEGNVPNSSVISATHLLIAIENAANIFREPTAEQKPVLAERVEEFRRMIACLRKTDYCRLNLSTRIRHTIDVGTSDGWLPKLYAVNPQHIVSKLETFVEFFGKFKYADTAKYKKTYQPTLVIGERTFEPTHADHHKLTFQIKFDAEKSPFKKDKCSQFEGRLIVPYEVGHLNLVLAQRRTFEFTVPIRALPTIAGVLNVALEDLNEKKLSSHEMGWEEHTIVHLVGLKTAALMTFTSFEGKKQEFTALQLEAEAAKVFPKPAVVEGAYLRISQIVAIGEDANRWKVETIPPVGF